MRYIKIYKEISIENLYVKVTCKHCQKQYGVHIRRPNQFRTCPCGRATFYFTIGMFKNYIGFGVLWVGPFEEREEIEVDAIEISEKEVPWQDEMDEE